MELDQDNLRTGIAIGSGSRVHLVSNSSDFLFWLSSFILFLCVCGLNTMHFTS